MLLPLLLLPLLLLPLLLLPLLLLPLPSFSLSLLPRLRWVNNDAVHAQLATILFTRPLHRLVTHDILSASINFLEQRCGQTRIVAVNNNGIEERIIQTTNKPSAIYGGIRGHVLLPSECVARVLQFANARVCHAPLWCRFALRAPWTDLSPALVPRACAMLYSIQFIGVPLRVEDVMLLQQKQHLPALKQLRLCDNDADVSPALAHAWQQTLLTLQIGNDPVYADSQYANRGSTTLCRGWATAARWTHLALRELSLSNTNVCMRSLCASVRNSALPHIDTLHLDYNAIDARDATELARAFQERRRGQRGVRHLELGYNRIANADELLAVVVQWERSPFYLGLGGNQLRTVCLPPMPALEMLVLECNEFKLITAYEISRLLDAGAFPRLTVLDMEDNYITYVEQIALEQHLQKKLTDVLLYNGLHAYAIA